MGGDQKLEKYCIEVLKQNDLGGWTRPAPGLYPHQWLWDSCFIAIGQRHYNVKRAQKEIENLFRGQWRNGMIPNIIMSGKDYYADKLWNSHLSPDAPKKLKTSGITQPPMIAEAVVKIGEYLTAKDREAWYKKIYPDLLAYHEWLYRERDPHCEGLVSLIHPWESGLDNNPGWMRELHYYNLPNWIKAVRKLKLDKAFTLFRKDTKFLPAYQRIDTIDALALFSIARQLTRKHYETKRVFRGSTLNIEDLAFNCILIRANTLLVQIMQEINQEMPPWLWGRMKKAPHALELLWSENNGQYFSRNFETFELIDEPSIMTLLPLYAGTISKNKAKTLVELMKTKPYWPKYPLPSTPINSKFFNQYRYWQGPTWININWLVADGLKRYGYLEEAKHIKQSSLGLVKEHGAYEYFSPLSGRGVGAHPFSWTAALVIDFLHQID